MEEYRVIISPAAQNDFLDIEDYLNTLSPDMATQYYAQFMDKMKMLLSVPDFRPFARDTQLRLRGYRMMSAENYIIFYVITGRTVEIRRILYARRQYERLL